MSPKVWGIYVAVVALFITIAVWDVKTCAEWGPPVTSWITQSCGDGCITTTPVESRPCIRRKR